MQAQPFLSQNAELRQLLRLKSPFPLTDHSMQQLAWLPAFASTDLLHSEVKAALPLISERRQDWT